MSNITPLKGLYDSLGKAIGLSEFNHGDTIPIEHGGTGATTPETARSNLGLGNVATYDITELETVAGYATKEYVDLNDNVLSTRITEEKENVVRYVDDQNNRIRIFQFVFVEPTLEWVINHGMGTRRFNYKLLDETGNEFMAKVDIIDSNSFSVNVTKKVAGVVEVSFSY